jgi:CMP-N,N'-diacetyllegionaminic acid synthase
MEILAIIPARGGSKGIPMKNLIKLNKKPLLEYSITSALNSKFITKTIVSTDNKKIANYSKKLNAEVIIRPKKFATNTSKIEPVIEHSINFLKKNSNFIPDLIVLLQNTSPFRTSKHIDNALKLYFQNSFDSILSVYASHSFFWKKVGSKYTAVNYDPQKRLNRQNFKDQFIENGAIYITKYSLFKKNKNRISGKVGIFEMNENDSIDIDTTLDLLYAESILKSKSKK